MAGTVVILQSSYLPWKGYFDVMNAADLFVIYDEVQYTRRDWRNRNKIIIDGKSHWLTIPVDSKGQYHTPIRDIKISDKSWARKHWTSIRHSYGKAPFFENYENELARAYDDAGQMELLSDVNQHFLQLLAGFLAIDTPFADSEKVPRSTDDPARRLIEICQVHGADTYLSGPAAKSYIEPLLFEQAGLRLAYADYGGYPTYNQNTLEFEHGVSVLDLLMRVGPDARQHLKSENGFENLVEPA